MTAQEVPVRLKQKSPSGKVQKSVHYFDRFGLNLDLSFPPESGLDLAPL